MKPSLGRFSKAFANIEARLLKQSQRPAGATFPQAEPTGTTSEALRITQRADFDRWGTIVHASGFKADAE
jgi:hypothetical protein